VEVDVEDSCVKCLIVFVPQNGEKFHG